ncbi:PH domain-containing protein [Candidatus Saccharibacteria bacterium]|jgi:hypothetical protein|nr:PH domain-containing protein [Candidatus Saccharibacteria bacterium]
MAAYTQAHGQRIKRELKEAGATGAGLLKFSNRYLPNVIKEDEHIEAVAYGRYPIGEGSKVWRWEAGTLVATDQRVLFVDRKPGFLRADKVPYEGVSGVESLKAWPFSSITLLTRIGTFTLRYVRMSQADRFVGYVESRRQQS